MTTACAQSTRATAERPSRHTCRAFPCLFVVSPVARRAGLCFACTAVALHHRAAVAEQEELVREIATLAPHREHRGVGIRRAPGDPLPWSAWLALEREIDHTFASAPSTAAWLLAIERLVRERAALPAAVTIPSAALALAARHWLLELGGAPPRFRPPLPEYELPDDGDLLRRWIRHRLWRRDLLRGNEILLALARLDHGASLARRGRRLLRAPRRVASMTAGSKTWEIA